MHEPGTLIALRGHDGHVYLGVVAHAAPDAGGRLLDVDVIADGAWRSSTIRSVRVT